MTAFINFVSEKLIHAQQNKQDGRSFYSVSIPCPESKNGFGTIAVSPKQILPATRKDKTVVPGFNSVLLGDPDRTRRMSLLTDDGYRTIELTNAEITKMFESSRSAYKASAAPAAAQA